VSLDGLTLANDLVWTYPFAPPETSQISSAGTSIDKALLIIILLLVAFNAIFAGDGEYMWGMMNTLQIIFYFPILSHYFPIFVMQFLKYF